MQKKSILPPVLRPQRHKKCFEIKEPVVQKQKEEKESLPSQEQVPDEPVINENQAEITSSNRESNEVIEARPLYRNNPKPKYPALAQRRGWQGTTILAVTVQHNGKPLQVRLHESCGYSILDDSAMKAVRKWTFLPATRGGLPIEMDVFVPVHFLLTQ